MRLISYVRFELKSMFMDHGLVGSWEAERFYLWTYLRIEERGFDSRMR